MNASASDLVVHFNAYDLAKRWGLSPGTLNHWRRYGKGPIYLKIGGHVTYRLEDIEAYEKANLRSCTEKSEGTKLG